MPRKKAILWVEDDVYYKTKVGGMLEIAGFEVIEAPDAQHAIDILQSQNPAIDVVILDVAMPHGGAFPERKSKAGHETGLLLGSWIHDRYPRIPIIGFSLSTSPEVRDWFCDYGNGYFRKGSEEWGLVDYVKRVLGTGHIRNQGPRIFIVHGHDEDPIPDLKKLLRTSLRKQPDIFVLRDLPADGRTIIEKFEKTADQVDVVFVLLTPDDLAFPRSRPEKLRGRARQNVVFELGYFYAKLQRIRGRVVVLCKGDVEKPTDIAGIEYIDISSGISPVAKKIKQELADWI